jgi:hypothetical protein
MTDAVADGPERLGTVEPEDLTEDIVRGVLRGLYLKGKALVNVCTNRIPVRVNTTKGRVYQSLTFKAAKAYGKSTARAWFAIAVGPQTDNSGKAHWA